MLLSGADISGAGVEALVGQRITVGNDNITVLVIAQPAAPVQEITGMAERAVEHLARLKPEDSVMLLTQHGYPPTLVPPEYPLNWVTSVSARSGGQLTTVAKANAPVGMGGGRSTGGSGCVRTRENLPPSPPSSPDRPSLRFQNAVSP